MRVLMTILEFILPFIIKIMVHKKETLTKKEQRAQKVFMEKLRIVPRKTKKPVIIAMVGLVGSGKTFVANELANFISGTIVEGDKIRVCLRKEGEKYEGARKIAENVVLKVIKQGGTVVLDSDHINKEKRASLREKVKGKVKLIFVRTHMERDVMIGRIFSSLEDEFFSGAGKKYGQLGVVIKMREMWRRTPHHYRWENKGGGRWILKKLPFKVVEIDTTDPKKCELTIQELVKELI